jgi:F-type H+-transporting ATPase subunit delta
MPKSPSPRRYAHAVLQIALETGGHLTWADDLRTLTMALDSEGLAALLDAPHVPVGRKAEAIAEVLGDSVSGLARNLLSLLASRNQVHLLPGVLDEYERLVDEHGGVERAVVTSAVDLEDEQKEKVAGFLNELVGKEVRLTTVVESGVLGGLVARVGDRVVDGSVRSKLREMRRSIVEQMA